MPTPHISAEPGQFAEAILLPGDPLRAKYIAENFLTDAELVTSVRNMLGYTGTYNGNRVSLRDVVIATGACTDSLVNRTRYANWDFAAIADFGLAKAAVEAAEAGGFDVKVGNVHSADLFYNPTENAFDVMEGMGVLAVEMEAAGLYGVAAEKGARALTIATVSDHVRTGEATSSDERQTSFNSMIDIALDALERDGF